MVSLVQGEPTLSQQEAAPLLPVPTFHLFCTDKESPAAKVSSISVLFFCCAKKANIVSPAVIGKIEQDMSGSEHELTLALVKQTRNVNEYEQYFRES